MKLPRLNFWLLLVLGIVLLLRLPSLWEPYWYGDEQIYLALGQAMNHGAVLYRDIWDNKPPLLYILYAIIPTLVWAKAVATVFVLGTCLGIYVLAKYLIRNTRVGKAQMLRNYEILPLLVTLLVGVFLSIPLFEGTIANAELFFTLPIVWASYIIYKKLLAPNPFALAPIAVGFLMFIAFLFKVPAVFDFLGMFLFLAILIFKENLSSPKNLIVNLFKTFLPIFIAFAIPLVLVFVYFYFNHALKDFIIAAFSQNASYVSVDSGPLSKLSNPLFVKAAILVASCLLLGASYFKKLISKELLFLALWFGFSLYGGLLSGRPYMHYLLQIVPPFVLLVLYVIYYLLESKRFKLGTVFVATSTFLIAVYLSQLFHGAFHLPTVKYYQNWYDFVSERKSWQQYVSFFDRRTLNSYAIANYIDKNTSSNDPIFVWADAASVYVLSNRPPATRFIQAHHLTTIDPVNYDLIIQKIELEKPKLIIIGKPTQFAFPKLDALVAKDYQEVSVFNNLHAYKLLL